jgi:hypothetical protein
MLYLRLFSSISDFSTELKSFISADSKETGFALDSSKCGSLRAAGPFSTVICFSVGGFSNALDALITVFALYPLTPLLALLAVRELVLEAAREFVPELGCEPPTELT